MLWPRRTALKCLLIISFFIIGFSLALRTTAHSEEKPMFRGELVVEHAKVIPERGSKKRAKIYM